MRVYSVLGDQAFGRKEALRMLLEAGAHVNLANKDGWTPLNGAANYDHPSRYAAALLNPRHACKCDSQL